MWKRKIIFLFFICILLCTSCVNHVEDEGSGNKEVDNDASSYLQKDEEILTAIAGNALYDELTERYSSNLYDLGKTRVSFGSIENESFGWMVYGTYTLYDKYGSIDMDHYDEKFTVSINTNGATYCTLS